MPSFLPQHSWWFRKPANGLVEGESYFLPDTIYRGSQAPDKGKGGALMLEQTEGKTPVPSASPATMSQDTRGFEPE